MTFKKDIIIDSWVIHDYKEFNKKNYKELYFIFSIRWNLETLDQDYNSRKNRFDEYILSDFNTLWWYI